MNNRKRAKLRRKSQDDCAKNISGKPICFIGYANNQNYRYLTQEYGIGDEY